MEREIHQWGRKITAVVGIWLAIGCMNALGGIVYIEPDYAQTIEVVQQTPQAGHSTESLYLSMDGINSISGEIEITITATRTIAGNSGRTKKLSGLISASGDVSGGAVGNMLTSEGELIGPDTSFSLDGDPLLELNLSDNKFKTETSATITGYLPIQFSVDGTDSVIYGWAEIEATISLINGPADELDIATTLITVKSMAYETNWDEPIATGAVPEPSVLILVLFIGISTLAGRRIFPNLKTG